MKKVTTWGPMKGAHNLETGEVIEIKKDQEIVHNYKQILEMLADCNISITIKKIEEIDEEDSE